MAAQNSEASKTTRQKRIEKTVQKISGSLEGFVRKHPDTFIVPPGLDFKYWDTIEWLQRATKLAGQENNAIVFSLVLQGWLRGHGIVAPRGVFNLNIEGPGPGRPRNPEKDRALALYLEHPGWSFGKIAIELYPSIQGDEQKKARDRVRSLIKSALRERGADFNLLQTARRRHVEKQQRGIRQGRPAR